MKFRVLTALVAFCLFVPVFAVSAEEATAEASASYAKGQELLQSGDFAGALKAYTAAAKAAPENKEYTERAMVVRRILSYRKFAVENPDSPKWGEVVQSLHVFYVTQGLLNEALNLDEKVHARTKTAASASLLAETLLELGKNEETVKLLTPFETKAGTERTRVCLGIALARLGEKERARAISAACPVKAEATPSHLVDQARLNMLLGKKAQGIKALTLCLEQLPKSRHETIRTYVNGCADFGPFRKSSELDVVMQTKSKVPESACSSGADCGSCPSKGGCDSEKKIETETKKAVPQKTQKKPAKGGC